MPIIAGHYVVAYANSAGFVDQDLLFAVTIAKAETNWNTDYLLRAPETEQRGLWGINWAAHTQFDRTKLMDPTYNAWVARQLFIAAGHDWRDWQTYLTGEYSNYFPDADQAIAEFQGYGGDPGTSVAPPASSYPPPINTGLYPNFGPFDPAPYLRAFGDTLHDWAVAVNGAVNAVYDLMR